MSDMTALSHEYEASASFAEDVNRDVLQLKKSYYRNSDVCVATDDAPRGSRDRLAAVLAEITHRLADASDADSLALGEGNAAVPEEVLERIEAKHRNRMAYFLQDLQAAATRLRSRGELDELTLKVLDEICDAADATASATFRRLRRR